MTRKRRLSTASIRILFLFFHSRGFPFGRGGEKGKERASEGAANRDDLTSGEENSEVRSVGSSERNKLRGMRNDLERD